MAGYSGTPLAKKLGIRPRLRIKVKNAPANYLRLLGPLPDDVQISSQLRSGIDLWHLFTRSRSELARELRRCITQMQPDGMIWVSWPKKSSSVETDLSENTIRELALPLGLVDIKVCAVDDTWSGLKFVIRRNNRK